MNLIIRNVLVTSIKESVKKCEKFEEVPDDYFVEVSVKYNGKRVRRISVPLRPDRISYLASGI